jgi:6,7-dimethyl-8-ribityllumazine synthase
VRSKNHAMTLDGTNRGAGLRFAVVVARFNEFVTERLAAGALEALASAGVSREDIGVIRVPGAFEIPFAANQAAQGGGFDAIICLGCLIRGATAHFEYIAGAASQGIMAASIATGVPMTFGVLTTNSREEAMERAIPGPGNKGWEAAAAAVEMATLGLTGTGAAKRVRSTARPRRTGRSNRRAVSIRRRK